MEKIKVRILQDDCSAYGLIEAKNGATHEIDKSLAERMVSSGHALIEDDKAKTKPEPTK